MPCKYAAKARHNEQYNCRQCECELIRQTIGTSPVVYEPKCAKCAQVDDGKTFVSTVINAMLRHKLASGCIGCGGYKRTPTETAGLLKARAGDEAVKAALVRAVEQGMSVVEAEALATSVGIATGAKR